MIVVYVKEEFLSPILFAIYIDDLIKELRLAGFGVCVHGSPLRGIHAIC